MSTGSASAQTDVNIPFHNGNRVDTASRIEIGRHLHDPLRKRRNKRRTVNFDQGQSENRTNQAVVQRLLGRCADDAGEINVQTDDRRRDRIEDGHAREQYAGCVVLEIFRCRQRAQIFQNILRRRLRETTEEGGNCFYVDTEDGRRHRADTVRDERETNFLFGFLNFLVFL